VTMTELEDWALQNAALLVTMLSATPEDDLAWAHDQLLQSGRCPEIPA